jgi:hypothetical protein
VTRTKRTARPARTGRDAELEAAVREWSRKLVAQAPPLTRWQRERLAKLLDLGGGDDAA